jgi:hypothetical protein
MKCYIIPPNSNLDLMHLGDSFFCLAQHYIKNEEYRNFFKARVAEGKWVTLDNGAGDFALITEDILFDCMKDLRPSEVIPPDVIFDKDTTLKNLEQFIGRMAEEDLLSDIEIFACPQGATKEDWIECYKSMLENPYVATLGFSKIAVPFAFLGKKNDEGIAEARNMAYDYLVENNLLTKPIHCLGMGSPEEFSHYTSPLMRSSDSCNTVWSAMNDIKFKEGNFTRIKTPHDYFERTVTDAQIAVAKDNVEFLRSQFPAEVPEPTEAPEREG